ncbi:hypothetical protein [Gracilibacillus sp. YIM 98692]|uniref:hypothetical protein n=1 Tax=Gracilibacillus sp. YIM 98692 TaxID=2663532 RepID=UPI0013D41FCD|nr:hypothetical protein [Gracilibacillus sp. YIM 98692]
MIKNLSKGFLIMFMMLIFIILEHGVSAEANSDGLTKQIRDWEEEGIDPNHHEARDSVLDYISEHLSETYAGMYIDREQRDLGVMVFLFTEPVAEHHTQEMQGLIQGPAEIEFKEVAYTEEELRDKQKKIDSNGFEYEAFTITHTGVDIKNTIVEIGIDPYTEENAQTLYDQFGEEQIEIVEGKPVTTLEMETTSTDVNEEEDDKREGTDTIEENQPNFLGKVLQVIKNWFS